MTNKTPWTPGPWMVRDMHEVTALKHGVKIADAACRYSTLNEAKHNAALISLAPEMAEALLALANARIDDRAGICDLRARAVEIISRLPVAK